MQSGALIGLPEEFEIEQLDKCRWGKEERGIKLKNIIQFEGQGLKVGSFLYYSTLTLETC